MSGHIEIVKPEGWPRPRGYSNGMVARGKVVFVAGQIGWDHTETLVSDDFVAQFKQAIANVRAVVEAAGGQASDVVRLTAYLADVHAYRARHREVGAAYREVMGKHFPVMAFIGVKELVDPGALVEIEATAVLPEDA